MKLSFAHTSYTAIFGDLPSISQDLLRQYSRILLVYDNKLAWYVDNNQVVQPDDSLAFDVNEHNKNMSSVLMLIDKFIQWQMKKSDVVIAIGGGALLDCVGFAASIYLRGIAYISMPSTLLAMTDAAIGGKTAVNYMQTKNLVGSYYPPRTIVINTHLLTTLPNAEYLASISEIIKYALIQDQSMYDWLIKNSEALINRDSSAMNYIIRRCISIKNSIVSKDYHDTQGRRAVLNLGHTYGHALEICTNHKLNHGNAVAIGLQYIALFSLSLGANKQNIDKILHILAQYNLPQKFHSCDFEPIYKVMLSDKKNTKSSSINFMIYHDIGNIKMQEVQDIDIMYAAHNASVLHYTRNITTQDEKL